MVPTESGDEIHFLYSCAFSSKALSYSRKTHERIDYNCSKLHIVYFCHSTFYFSHSWGIDVPYAQQYNILPPGSSLGSVSSDFKKVDVNINGYRHDWFYHVGLAKQRLL